MNTPITSEAILNEDGVDAPLAEFATEVRDGEAAVRRLLKAEPGRSWGFSELREAARDDRRKTVMGAALMSLDRQGVLHIDYASYTVETA
jgi:hypothetical protein